MILLNVKSMTIDTQYKYRNYWWQTLNTQIRNANSCPTHVIGKAPKRHALYLELIMTLCTKSLKTLFILKIHVNIMMNLHVLKI